MSLRTRIAAIAGLAVAVTILGAAIAVYVSVRSNVRGEVERALEERAGPSQILDRLRGGPGGPPGFGRRPGFGEVPPAERFGGAVGYVQLVDPQGFALGPGGETAELPVTASTRRIARQGAGRAVDDVTVDDVHLLVLTRGSPVGAIQVARPLTETDRVLQRVLVVLVVVGLIGVALAVALGAFIARTALDPITRFTRRTEELAADRRISERIEVESDDEVGRLALSFNATLDELEAAVVSQRRLVADASHELRTPIASLRANIQTLEHADLLPPAEAAALRADILTELDELTALVGDVVELAREEVSGEALDDVRVDELVAVAVQRAERRGDKAVDFRVELEPTLVLGEPQRIGRAIANLLANARTWSPEDGVVEVTLRDGELVVRDHGPGFAPEDLPHVFERFYRSAAARGTAGSGLGLAIVRQAAEAHGGSVQAANAFTGGAELRVRFGELVTLGGPVDTPHSSPSLSNGEHPVDVPPEPRTKERA